jgi:hypothetical protein
MPHDPDAATDSPGGNVRVYERPNRLTTLAPLIWILITALILVIVFVLLVRQS